MLAEIKPKKLPEVWALTDDRAGNRSQCLGVADALGIDYQIKEIAYGSWAALPNALLGASFAGLTADSRLGIHPPWPDVVIAAGRRTAPVARKIRSLADRDGVGCFLAQVMDPGGGRADFGLLAVPRHDGEVSGPNILTITGAPHQLTQSRLDEEAGRWRERFDDLAKPWIALIVGGSTRRRTFTPDMARELAARASKMALLAGGSLLVSTSRRTGNAAEALIEAITAPSRVYRWGEGSVEENPYHAYLALADAVIVTGDSSSMCSEACAGTGPVYIYAPGALTAPKHGRLHEGLYQQGYARPLTGDMQDSGHEQWTHPPLNAAGAIAQAIRDRLGL
jgi:mitochondrial fission protein ELM1